MSILDWDDLDKANKQDGHYTRRPEFVVKAETALHNAKDDLNRVETAFENHQASFIHLDYASSVVNAVSHYAEHCRQCWHEGKDQPDQTLGEFLVQWEIIKPETPKDRINMDRVKKLETELLPDPGFMADQPPPKCYGL